jgi:hypothetical protein
MPDFFVCTGHRNSVHAIELMFLVNVVGTPEDTFNRHLAIKLYPESDGYRSFVQLRKEHKGNYRADKVTVTIRTQIAHLCLLFA